MSAEIGRSRDVLKRRAAAVRGRYPPRAAGGWVPERVAGELLAAATRLRRELRALRFGPPVSHVYDPLDYARRGYQAYVRAFGNSRKRVLFLGMNPGPFGMAQTGVPFGDVPMVRGWLRIEVPIGRPRVEHPKRPVEGFASRRSEVSGTRLWGALAACFGEPERFFAAHFVANYCPLAFLEASGRNRTPDKLPERERVPLFRACDAHLRRVVRALEPAWVIGIGAFAEARARAALPGARIGRITHPSPANPRAARDWSGGVRQELRRLGVWREPGGST
jgi:single-strand selective monofunctional uracil DNA glycosylase